MLTVLRLTLASTGSAHRAPSLTFMTEDAPQRDHSLRPPLSPPAGGAIASSARRQAQRIALRQAQRIARERPGA